MKVFIVEDQTRQELVELFATLEGFEVVGRAGSVREALRGIEATIGQVCRGAADHESETR